MKMKTEKKGGDDEGKKGRGKGKSCPKERLRQMFGKIAHSAALMIALTPLAISLYLLKLLYPFAYICFSSVTHIVLFA